MATRDRWLIRIAAYAVLAVGGAAQAQPARGPDPSPFAPGDLKRPIFDTMTPVYGGGDAQAKSAGTVVAEVDGRAVTLGDVQDAIAALPASTRHLSFADLFPGVLRKLVIQQALVIRAHRQAVDEDPVVRRAVKAASEQIIANTQLEHEASRPITEAALLARYGKDVAGKPGPEEVHVRVIMVATEKAATEIITELKAGADFGTVAKRVSLDTTASAGGDVGFVVRDVLGPEVGAVVFATPPGQFTQFPVQTASGWFVLKAEERRRQGVRPFSTVREELRQTMMREGVQAVADAALADVSVREFDINGKETDASSLRVGARDSAQ